MLTVNDIVQLQSVNPISVDKSTLRDIQSVNIKANLDKEDRILDFIEQIKNPYLFKCGDLVVQSIFADTEVTLTDRLKQYFRTV